MRYIGIALGLAALVVASGCGSSTTSSGTGQASAGITGATGTGGSNGHTTGNTNASTTTGTNGTSATNGTGSGTGSSGDGGCGLRTCASANANCGPIGDGCGGTIDCGDCTAGDFCGGGGASRCGPGSCVPTNCQALGDDCGAVSDGCGGILDCGNCSTGLFCGGGGPNKCGTGNYVDGGNASCTPRDCAAAGANCGPVSDGCGGLTANCGTCSGQDICGGSGVPSICGSSNRPDAGLACTGLCLQQQSCSGGATTTVTGTVYAPNGVDPLYDALVYVPNGPVAAFTPGVACLTCDQQISGDPLVATNTGPDGTFTLTNMPVGANIPLVIQLGRWRRQVTISNVPACTSTPIDASLTRLPKNKSEGDIPLTAMVTGSVDALECVLRKIGIDDAEFTNPGGGGRVQFYTAPTESGGDGPGATLNSSTPDGTALVDSTTTLNEYDMVLFACEGDQYDKTTSELQNILNYANIGGRVFATHYSYTWLYSPTTWQAAANWDPNAGTGNSATGILDTSFPKGQAFSQWLDVVHASTSQGSSQIDINQWRWDVDSVLAPAQQWIYLNQGGSHPVEHLTFNTPFNSQSTQCGRVLFSDFHVTDASTDPSINFPSECSSGALTAQEHVLEFMLFDLASCITPDQPPPPTCTAVDCNSVGAQCGQIADGCGGTVDCGQCGLGQVCTGTPGQCTIPSCTPLTCAQIGSTCGPQSDGCGSTITCGVCGNSEICSGDGTTNSCQPSPCTPTSCAAQAAQCGAIADGCGGVLQCGDCPTGQTCGLGGANLCGGFR